MNEKLTDDPNDLDGYAEWLQGAECPWFEISQNLYFNERTQQTFRWRPGQKGILSPRKDAPR